MRVALVFLLACSGTSAPKDPFAAGNCDGSWTANGFTDCEAGCMDSAKALGAKGPACEAARAEGSAFSCIATFDYGDATGCCVSDKPHLYFAQCQ